MNHGGKRLLAPAVANLALCNAYDHICKCIVKLPALKEPNLINNKAFHIYTIVFCHCGKTGRPNLNPHSSRSFSRFSIMKFPRPFYYFTVISCGERPLSNALERLGDTSYNGAGALLIPSHVQEKHVPFVTYSAPIVDPELRRLIDAIVLQA